MAEAVQEKETRVSMNWPESLREEVRALVGGRGTTAFTIDAVREKLARQKAGQDAPQEAEPVASEESAVETTPAPSAQTAPSVEPESPAPAKEPVEEEKPAPRRDSRGPAVAAVAPPTLGAASKYASSGSEVQELLKRAQELGMKRASEIPSPVRDEVHPAEEVKEATPDATEEQVNEPPERDPAPEPAPQPIATVAPRVLDDIEVDF